MSRSPTCHVIIDGQPNRGTWNMALDEALLTAAVERQLCAVRIYEWSEATVSLGYFQSPASVAASTLAAAMTLRFANISLLPRL